MQFQNTLRFAKQLDQQDPLKSFRDRFIIPAGDGKQQVYFLGNSLGLQPKSAKEAIQQVLQQWADFGVEGFFKGDEPWLQYHDSLTGPLSEIVGALPNEVVVMNQLSVNLHLMMVSFYKPSGKRIKILCEEKAFPSDQYMFETYIKHMGLNPGEVLIEISPRAGEYTIRTEDILSAIENHKEEIALIFFGGLNYYTGQAFDMQTITTAAHTIGAHAGFDLAHAVGNISLHLHNWNVDFACWCSYKYLNSGPGAVGGVFIHERFHSDTSIHRYAGWWGYKKETRFLMEKGFVPIPSAEGWQLSTPSMILYACHKAALDIFSEAGLDRLHAKRLLLNNYLWFFLDEINGKMDKTYFQIITPNEQIARGCQVSMLMHEQGKAIYDGLIQEGMIVDWREPNVIRLAPVPLYNTFEEVWRFCTLFEKLLE